MNGKKWRASLLALAVSASVWCGSAASITAFADSQRQIMISVPLVNIRTGISTEYPKLGVGRSGDTYEYLSSKIDEEGSTWYEIRFYEGHNAWVNSQYCRLISTSSATTTAPPPVDSQTDENAREDTPDLKYVSVTNGISYLREDAGNASPVIAKLFLGQTYRYLDESSAKNGKTWYQVQYTDDVTGWIPADTAITLNAAAIGTKSPEEVTIERIAAQYGAVGIQVALTENDVITDTYSCGYATKPYAPMSTNTKIRAASVSKMVVGMAAMKMQEEGLIDLDKDIGEYWGVTLAKPVTLRELLTHTSRLNQNYYKNSVQQTASQLKSSSSYRGTNDWMYNNYAIGIAGATMEVASGETLNHYMDRKFFTPLGIDAAFTSGDLQNTGLLATLYYNEHTAKEDRTAEDGETIGVMDASGNDTTAMDTSRAKSIHEGEPGTNAGQFAGGLTISARDLAKLTAVLANDGMYWNKRYLSVNSVKTIETQVCEGEARGHSFDQCISLRHQADIYGQEELYYHTGTAYGTLSLVAYHPKTRKGIVIITTGAQNDLDDYGIWNVCGKIAQYFYQR